MNMSTPIQNSILNSTSPLQPKAPYNLVYIICSIYISNNPLRILENNGNATLLNNKAKIKNVFK